MQVTGSIERLKATARGLDRQTSTASGAGRKSVTFRADLERAQDTEISIDDAIRGKVTWNTDTLGDFVILRSNGQPVYNFCVAVDDALMEISHVIRAEEHLPNSLRQVGPAACLLCLPVLGNSYV